MQGQKKQVASLLKQLKSAGPAPKTDRKKGNDGLVLAEEPAMKNFEDDFPYAIDANSFSSLGSNKPKYSVAQTDSGNKDGKLTSSNSDTQDLAHFSTFGSGDKSKHTPSTKKSQRSTDQLEKLNQKQVIPPAQRTKRSKVSRDDSSLAYRDQLEGKSIPKSSFHVPETSPLTKKRSSSHLLQQDYPKQFKHRSNHAPSKKIEEQVPPPQQDTNDLVENQDLIDKLGEPIRRRLVINLNTSEFQARRLQANAALDEVEVNVAKISVTANETNAALNKLFNNSRSISEKSMDLTQRTEAVMSKVNVMADWINGLENVGSGLKIQVIELLVKFVSFLSSLLLLFYQTVRKANPFALLRKKGNATAAVREDREEEEDY